MPHTRRTLITAAAALAALPAAAAPALASPVVELRQYTLHPGGRDVLMRLFDREFVEPQEALGMRLIGQFRDLDDPNRFVWLRGFPDMAARADMLKAFYGGPVWKAHRSEANATMLDSDNVLLLRPASSGGGFDLSRARRDAGAPRGRVTARIHYLDRDALPEFEDFFASTIRPALRAAGVRVLAALATEDSPNSFPALPIREGETVFTWFAAGDALLGDQPWRESATPTMLRQLMRKPETLRLQATDRSLLRGA